MNGSKAERRPKTKVTLIIPKFGLVGGAEAFAYETTTRIAESGEFKIAVYAQEWRRNAALIDFHKIPGFFFPRTLRPILFAWSVGKRLKTDPPDVIHTHERIFNSDLFTFHGIPHRTWVRQVREKGLTPFDIATAWVERKGIEENHGSRILPVSNLVRKELLRVYEIPEQRMQVIHPGVSIDRFTGARGDECRHGIRQRHGIAPTDLVVLFVGMNFEVKGLEAVLKSIAQIKGEGTRLKLLVVGRGETNRYTKMAEELGVSKQVVFAGVTNEVEKYYQASDLFMMPSLFDTFGLVVLEAMAAGLPVIISDKVGAKDLVQDGVNGFILEAKCPASDIATRIQWLQNQEVRLRAGRRAREAASVYSWDRTAAQIADLYRRCAEERIRNSNIETRNKFK